jgi:hypothetical protein
VQAEIVTRGLDGMVQIETVKQKDGSVHPYKTKPPDRNPAVASEPFGPSSVDFARYLTQDHRDSQAIDISERCFVGLR